MTSRVDIEVSNARGTLVYTSPQIDLARRWVTDNTARLGDLKVEIVTRTETRRPAPDSRVLPFAERLARRSTR